MWPENDTHDWSSDKVVTQRTTAKCGKKMMPIVGGLCLTADFGQMWSKLCPCWRTLSRSGLQPSVAQIVPLIGGLCHAVDFDQMWPKLCPSSEDFVTQRTSTKCVPKCAPRRRTLSHCGLQPNVVQTYAPRWRTLSHSRLQPNVVQTCAPQQRTLFCYGV